jgi:membrane protein DedA with SNARE-associated domain
MNVPRYLKDIVPLLIFLALVLILWVLWSVLGLPDKNELLLIFKDYFKQYGLIIVFLAAIVEGLLLIGWYLPGGTVMFLGVILVGKNIPLVLLNGLIITLGLLLAYTLNYLIGYYGWYKLLKKFGQTDHLEKYKNKLQKNLGTGLFMSYWHPNVAVWASTAAGILKINFKQFFWCSLLALFIWNMLWGALVYVLGERALTIASFKFIFTVLLVWIFIKLLISYRLSKIKTINN